MSKRPFVWHASRFGFWDALYCPWAVTLGKPKDLNDFEESFKTLPEAHSFAMGIVSAEQAQAVS